MADAGRRLTAYIYIPSASGCPSSDTGIIITTNGTTGVWQIGLGSTTCILRLYNNSAQIGTDGATLSTDTWYRISIGYTVVASGNNEFRVYVNGTQSISVTNATLGATTGTQLFIGLATGSPGANKVIYFDDIYVDDSTALTDPGDIRVTDKLPNANGSANHNLFDTVIGSCTNRWDCTRILARSATHVLYTPRQILL